MTNVIDTLQLMANLAVIAGVPFFIIKYWRRGKELGYQTYLATSRTSIDLERLLIDHPKILNVLEEREDWKKIPEWRYYIHALLILFENVFLCRNKNWLTYDEWEGWMTWMRWIKNHPSFQKIWEDGKAFYSNKFQEFMDKL